MAHHHSGSLWLNFRLENANYCILSDYIRSIAVPGKFEPLPDSPPAMIGITQYGQETIHVMGMREWFGMMNLQDRVTDFGMMKEMHINWVADLDRYVHEGGTFTKPLDPHRCKFGLWYDAFQTDNARLDRLLKKIANPHDNLHRCGAKIIELKAQGTDNQPQIEALLAQADLICKEEIVPLLDRLIEIYCSTNRGILLVVGDGEHAVGLLVDEVRSLIPCAKTRQQAFPSQLARSPYLGEIVLHEGIVMLEVDIPKILDSVQ